MSNPHVLHFAYHLHGIAAPDNPPLCTDDHVHYWHMAKLQSDVASNIISSVALRHCTLSMASNFISLEQQGATQPASEH